MCWEMRFVYEVMINTTSVLKGVFDTLSCASLAVQERKSVSESGVRLNNYSSKPYKLNSNWIIRQSHKNIGSISIFNLQPQISFLESTLSIKKLNSGWSCLTTNIHLYCSYLWTGVMTLNLKKETTPGSSQSYRAVALMAWQSHGPPILILWCHCIWGVPQILWLLLFSDSQLMLNERQSVW